MGEGYQVQMFRQQFVNSYFSYTKFRYQMQSTAK